MTHNSIPQCSPRFLAVLCERCFTSPGKELGPLCPVCEGKRFYRWDPVTEYCFTYEYEPLFVENGQGEIVQLVRRRPARSDEKQPAVEEMLRKLGDWADEDDKRKFKLWYEGGWNAYLSSNKLKGATLEIEHEELERCVRECYKKVFSSTRKKSSSRGRKV